MKQSVIEKVFGVVVMHPVLSYVAFSLGEEVCTEQAVEINQHHNIYHYHASEEESTMVQPGIVLDDVPGEVELGAKAKYDIGEDVDELVDVVHGGGLGARQLQHQPHVQRDTVDLHKESDYSAGHIQMSVEGVQETRDHHCMMEQEFP